MNTNESELPESEYFTPEDEESEESEEFEDALDRVENVRRLNVRSYDELLERLELILKLNPEYEYRYFSLRINYRLLGQQDDIFRVTDERRFQNMRIRDMIHELTREIHELEERYHVILVERDDSEEDEEEITKNLSYAILTEMTPSFGKGNKNFNFVFSLDNELWSVIFPSTRCKCLIECVYNHLGKSKSDRFFKNTSFKDMKYDTMLDLIRNNLKIEVLISQTLDTLKFDIRNRTENSILLFGRDGHVGYIIKGLEEFESVPKSPSLPNFALKSRCVLVGYDCEYSYDKLDGEYFPVKSNLICAVVNDGKSTYDLSFKSFNKYIIYLEELAFSTKSDVYCYAHNAQKVENAFVLQEIVRMKNMRKTVVYNFNGNKIKSYSYHIRQTVKRPKQKDEIILRKISFIDTLCYVKESLDNISRMFNLTTSKGHKEWPEFKTKEEKDEWYFNKKWSIKNKNDVEYCTNDARIALELVLKLDGFVKEIFEREIVQIYTGTEYTRSLIWTLNKSSMASVCRSIFHNIYPEILNTSEDASVFKTMYYGGRNECFYIGTSFGDKVVHTIDINSAYPFEMQKGFAGEYMGDAKKLLNLNYPDVETVVEFARENNFRWVSYMVLKYKTQMKFPLLAVFKNGKLLFPNIMTYNLVPIWDVEYEAIKGNLHIQRIEYVGFFNSCSFKDQIEKLAHIKMNTKDKAMRNFSKIIMNSIYGISGMDSYRPVKALVKRDAPIECISSDYYISEAFDDFNWIQYRQFTKVNASFQSASSITAQARLKLWNMLNFADQHGFIVLYCDTDSVMMMGDEDISVFSDFLHPTELGKWDIETHDMMRIFTNKVYYYKDGENLKIKFKGLNSDKIKGLKESDFVFGNKFVVEGTKVTRQLTISLYKHLKEFSLNYTKGIVLKDGFIKPFDI